MSIVRQSECKFHHCGYINLKGQGMDSNGMGEISIFENVFCQFALLVPWKLSPTVRLQPPPAIYSRRESRERCTLIGIGSYKIAVRGI